MVRRSMFAREDVVSILASTTLQIMFDKFTIRLPLNAQNVLNNLLLGQLSSITRKDVLVQAKGHLYLLCKYPNCHPHSKEAVAVDKTRISKLNSSSTGQMNSNQDQMQKWPKIKHSRMRVAHLWRDLLSR